MSPSREATPPPLELWGGVECTLNRVGDAFHDQLARSGHDRRLRDLDAFAELGLRTLRYPVLWERACRHAGTAPDWSWTDERLARLRDLGVRPIAGLVHHGSGPLGTDLLDPTWPERLAAFARAAAERYPWIEDWTPVNEPLTTARFSALYGHWHPHARDPLAFARALLHQCRAIVLAMREIRAVVPGARLVQTEDLGKTHATPRLAYQAEFENERRWLTLDLLGGRVVPPHPLWHHLRWLGVDERELGAFAEDPCPPDLFGVNHYVTSERFLDERLRRYPPGTHGGNGRDAYADVEAVRVLGQGCDGPEALLREAWERHRIPMAITEAHLGCTREEQLRWLVELWDAAQAARAAGVDVRAVTAWSLLGAYDWCSLATRGGDVYEPGAFDVRGGVRRATAVAEVVRAFAAGRRPEHPVLEEVGWWRRPARFAYAPVSARARAGVAATAVAVRRAAPASILLVGGGPFAGALRARCEERGLAVFDVDERRAGAAAALSREVRARRAWAVVHVLAGGGDPAVRHAALEPVLRAGGACGAHLLVVSSGAVFGTGNGPARAEDDPVEPDDAEGRALADLERRVLAARRDALLVRLGAPLGTEGDVLERALGELARDGRVRVAADVRPTWSHFPDAAQAALDLLVDRASGVWHLAAEPATSPADVVRGVAARAGFDPRRVADRPRWAVRGDAPSVAARPLRSTRGALVPSLDTALDHWSAAHGHRFRGDRAVARR